MLQPDPSGPGTLIGEVAIVGGRLMLALSEPGDRLILLSSCADPALGQLTAGSVDALILALVDARARMAAQLSTSA